MRTISSAGRRRALAGLLGAVLCGAATAASAQSAAPGNANDHFSLLNDAVRKSAADQAAAEAKAKVAETAPAPAPAPAPPATGPEAMKPAPATVPAASPDDEARKRAAARAHRREAAEAARERAETERLNEQQITKTGGP